MKSSEGSMKVIDTTRSDVKALIASEAEKIGLRGCCNHACYIVKPLGVGTNAMCSCDEKLHDSRFESHRFLRLIGMLLTNLGSQIIQLQRQLNLAKPVEERCKYLFLGRRVRNKLKYYEIVYFDTEHDAKIVSGLIGSICSLETYVLPDQIDQVKEELSDEEFKKIPVHLHKIV